MKDKNGERMPLTYIIPQYHVLIPKPVDEVHKERLRCFDAEAERFLKESSKIDEVLSIFISHSETWINLFFRLVEMLRVNNLKERSSSY